MNLSLIFQVIPEITDVEANYSYAAFALWNRNYRGEDWQVPAHQGDWTPH